MCWKFNTYIQRKALPLDIFGTQLAEDPRIDPEFAGRIMYLIGTGNNLRYRQRSSKVAGGSKWMTWHIVVRFENRTTSVHGQDFRETVLSVLINTLLIIHNFHWSGIMELNLKNGKVKTRWCSHLVLILTWWWGRIWDAPSPTLGSITTGSDAHGCRLVWRSSNNLCVAQHPKTIQRKPQRCIFFPERGWLFVCHLSPSVCSVPLERLFPVHVFSQTWGCLIWVKEQVTGQQQSTLRYGVKWHPQNPIRKQGQIVSGSYPGSER